MKVYTDVFKKPLDKKEVVTAIMVIIMGKSVSASLLQRQMKIGYGKAATIIRLLEDAGVVSEQFDIKPRTILINRVDSATNAALRQLRKGNA